MFVPLKAGEESREQGGRVCSAVMFPPGSILRWQQPVTITGVPLCVWVLLLVSSAVVVFICEPCFFQYPPTPPASWILCSFNLNLTLFSLLMFKAVMIGCDKRDISLHPQKQSDGLSDSCLLPLVMLHSHHVILFLIAFCHVHVLFKQVIYSRAHFLLFSLNPQLSL